MTQDSSTFWKKSRVELRAAGFDPDRSAETSAVVTIASAWTNAHRCNNRVRSISDLLVELPAAPHRPPLGLGVPPHPQQQRDVGQFVHEDDGGAPDDVFDI